MAIGGLMARRRDPGPAHPDRKEIARYLLSRGLDELEQEPEPAPAGGLRARALAPAPAMRSLAAVAAAKPTIVFPDGLAPLPRPLDPAPASSRALPKAEVVVITWTVDELAALAHVLTPAISPTRWYRYTRRFGSYAKQIRPGAPAQQSKRLGSYMPTLIGSQTVLCVKSELHLNQDGIKTGEGTATLPVKDFFKQIIAETNAKLVLTIGTSGSVFDEFELGDVVVTRAARFRLQNEFRNEPFNRKLYKSNWQIPTQYFEQAQALMAGWKPDLAEPPFGPPTKRYPFSGDPVAPPPATPDIKLDGRDMPAFHPILTTDYFEYGTSANRLDTEGAAVEMGDAALGLACSELDTPPNWAVIRNMSDPVINGDLPAKQYHLNEQTTWAVGYYTAYGKYTSICGALATWAIIAGLNK
jgi:nucleoside phosphorylase